MHDVHDAGDVAMTAPLKQANSIDALAKEPVDLFERVRLAAIHAALEAIITVDEQQHIVMINPAAERLFGVAAVDALGSDLARFIPPRLREKHAEHVRAFNAAGQRELPMATRAPVLGLRANGNEIPLEATVSRVESLGPHGRQVHFTVLMRDLSNEHGLQSALDTFRKQMRAVSDLAPVAMWITDAQQIVFANRACARLFGAADPADLMGRTIFELMPAESHVALRRRLEEAQAGGKVTRARIAALDGTPRDVEIAIAALPDHGQSALQMVISDVTQRRHEQDAQDRSRRQLRGLAASQVLAREDERRRIARELHDELGQRLTALKMELSTLDGGIAPQALRQRLVQMMEMVDETIASVRHIAKDLRPAMLDDLGLNAAIEWLANDTSRRLGIEVTLQLDETEPASDDGAAITLYRIVQEALTNVARHARATRVRIALRQEGEGLTLTVQDDGAGFKGDALDGEGSYGLVGIRERAYMLGGDLWIDSVPEGGVRLSVRIPLAGSAPRRRKTDT